MVVVWHCESGQELYECRDGFYQETDQHLHEYANNVEVELHWL
jgi:hypothetical protein